MSIISEAGSELSFTSYIGEHRFIIKQSDDDDEKSKCLVPIWAVILGISCCIFILILLSASLSVVYFAPRPGLYQESCSTRSCVKGLSLKCIDGTCSCDTGYIYIGKCTLKKEYMEKCHLTSYCKDSTNMTCLDGVCKCDNLSYWNNKKCVSKVSNGRTCSSEAQCLTDSLLYCDLKSKRCICNSTIRYFYLL
jgi:hypothetical protein